MKLVLALFVLFVAVQLYEAAPPKKENCKNICPSIYQPVCAYDPQDNNRERTFGSDCVFKAHNCEHKNRQLRKKHDGECKSKNGQKGGVRLS